MANNTLSAKQQRFVDEYLVDLNAAQAAIRAGYSEKAARQQGQRLLTKADIQQVLKERQRQRSEQTQITGARVVQELARLGTYDVRELFHGDGTPKAIHELSDDTAAAIVGLDVVTVGNSEMGVGSIAKIKLADKNAALDKLMRHLGEYERDNKQSGASLAEAIGRATKRINASNRD